MDFKIPIGINFDCLEEQSIETLSVVLCLIAEFLQGKESNTSLFQYEDWLEHDGLIYYKGKIDFHAFFKIIGTPEQLLKSMQGDEYVHVGVLSTDPSWYLRFYVYWNDEGTALQGRFDITLQEPLLQSFRDCISSLNIKFNEDASDDYFERISD